MYLSVIHGRESKPVILKHLAHFSHYPFRHGNGKTLVWFHFGLPSTSQKHDSIWVIIDRLTKTAHFLPIHTTYSTKKYAEVYLNQIVRLHGVPKTIISDRGAPFIARFWEQLQYALGTKLI
jgi:hypothetical protein